MDTTYHPLDPRQTQLTDLMNAQGGPEGLILAVVRNLTYVSKCLAEIDTDELIRARHEAATLGKSDPDYKYVAKTIEIWLNHKKTAVELSQSRSKNGPATLDAKNLPSNSRPRIIRP